MKIEPIIQVAVDLDRSGLLWSPEIGDEVCARTSLDRVSILVDPQGLTPTELRECFLWLPNTEQLVAQIEARQALICHAGINDLLTYEAVIKAPFGVVETSAPSLRLVFAEALKYIISGAASRGLH